MGAQKEDRASWEAEQARDPSGPGPRRRGHGVMRVGGFCELTLLRTFRLLLAAAVASVIRAERRLQQPFSACAFFGRRPPRVAEAPHPRHARGWRVYRVRRA